MNFPFFIAKRYLSRQKGAFSAFIIRLAITATALSVAVMILSVAFIGGFKTAIRDKLYSYWGHVVVVPFNNNPSNVISASPIHLDASMMSYLKQIPHVTQVAPFIVRPAIIQHKGQIEGIRLKGVGRDYHAPSGLSLSGGPIDYTDSGYAKDIIVARTTADKLDIKIGDTVQLYFLEAKEVYPRIRKVRVAGLYHTGMEEIDKFYGLCDIRLLQRMNNWNATQINGYQIDADDEKNAQRIADKIYEESDLSTQTLTDSFPGIIDWLNIQNTSVSILIIIMSIVAVINLSAALVILIVERANVTGVLKALGLPGLGAQKIFLYIAGLIGSIGIVAGNVMALAVCFLQKEYGFLKMKESYYFMDTVPVHVNWGYVAIIDVCTLSVCILCMWLPSLYVRRIEPARVLRFK